VQNAVGDRPRKTTEPRQTPEQAGYPQYGMMLGSSIASPDQLSEALL
jgi:hypothetical protein